MKKLTETETRILKLLMKGPISCQDNEKLNIKTKESFKTLVSRMRTKGLEIGVISSATNQKKECKYILTKLPNTKEVTKTTTELH